MAAMLHAAADEAAVPGMTAARGTDRGSESLDQQPCATSQQPLLVIADDNLHLRSMRQQARRPIL